MDQEGFADLHQRAQAVAMAATADSLMQPSFSEHALLRALHRLLPEVPESEWRRAWQRLATAIIRGGAAGLTVRGGLHLLSTLLWLMRTSKPARPPARQHPKRGLSAGAMAEDTLRYTLFLATLGGTYVTVDEGLAILGGKERTSKWRALVAGAVAGHTMLMTGSRDRHHSLATYVLLRGLTLLVRCGNKRVAANQQRHQQQQQSGVGGKQTVGASVLRWLLAPTRLQHGDVLLMCAASAQIIYSYIMMPNTLPASYIRFLGKQAAKQPFVWQAVREQALRNWKGLAPQPLKPLQGTPWQQCIAHTPCEFWHPGQTCTGHALTIFPQSYLRSLGVYIPVYLVPALLVHRHKLLRTPQLILPKMAFAIARSSLFLTSFIALAFGGACLGFGVTGTSTGPIIGAFTAAGGLATFVEKKSRRMELALYCTSRAAESFAWCLQQWGLVPSSLVPARLDVVLFSVGCAAIMHCYSDACGQHRDVFRSKYLSVLDTVFGNTGVSEGAITHLPSNLDLVKSMGRRLGSFSMQTEGQHLGGRPGASGTPFIQTGNGNGNGTADPRCTRRAHGTMAATASMPAFQSFHATLLATARQQARATTTNPNPFGTQASPSLTTCIPTSQQPPLSAPNARHTTSAGSLPPSVSADAYRAPAPATQRSSRNRRSYRPKATTTPPTTPDPTGHGESSYPWLEAHILTTTSFPANHGVQGTAGHLPTGANDMLPVVSAPAGLLSAPEGLTGGYPTDGRMLASMSATLPHPHITPMQVLPLPLPPHPRRRSQLTSDEDESGSTPEVDADTRLAKVSSNGHGAVRSNRAVTWGATIQGDDSAWGALGKDEDPKGPWQDKSVRGGTARGAASMRRIFTAPCLAILEQQHNALGRSPEGNIPLSTSVTPGMEGRLPHDRPNGSMLAALEEAHSPEASHPTEKGAHGKALSGTQRPHLAAAAVSEGRVHGKSINGNAQHLTIANGVADGVASVEQRVHGMSLGPAQPPQEQRVHGTAFLDSDMPAGHALGNGVATAGGVLSAARLCDMHCTLMPLHSGPCLAMPPRSGLQLAPASSQNGLSGAASHRLHRHTGGSMAGQGSSSGGGAAQPITIHKVVPGRAHVNPLYSLSHTSSVSSLHDMYTNANRVHSSGGLASAHKSSGNLAALAAMAAAADGPSSTPEITTHGLRPVALGAHTASGGLAVGSFPPTYSPRGLGSIRRASSPSGGSTAALVLAPGTPTGRTQHAPAAVTPTADAPTSAASLPTAHIHSGASPSSQQPANAPSFNSTLRLFSSIRTQPASHGVAPYGIARAAGGSPLANTSANTSASTSPTNRYSPRSRSPSAELSRLKHQTGSGRLASAFLRGVVDNPSFLDSPHVVDAVLAACGGDESRRNSLEFKLDLKGDVSFHGWGNDACERLVAAHQRQQELRQAQIREATQVYEEWKEGGVTAAQPEASQEQAACESGGTQHSAATGKGAAGALGITLPIQEVEEEGVDVSDVSLNAMATAPGLVLEAPVVAAGEAGSGSGMQAEQVLSEAQPVVQEWTGGVAVQEQEQAQGEQGEHELEQAQWVEAGQQQQHAEEGQAEWQQGEGEAALGQQQELDSEGEGASDTQGPEGASAEAEAPTSSMAPSSHAPQAAATGNHAQTKKKSKRKGRR